MKSVIAVFGLFALVCLSACAQRQLPAHDLVALLPPDTTSLLAVQSPAGEGESRVPFDEGALVATLGIRDLALASAGASLLSMDLWLLHGNSDIWFITGGRDAATISNDHGIDFATCKPIFIIRSEYSSEFKDEIVSRAEVAGDWSMGRYYRWPAEPDNSPDSDVQVVAGRSAYFAFLDQQTILITLDAHDLLATTHRFSSRSRAIPRSFRGIASAVPEDASAFMLRTPLASPGGPAANQDKPMPTCDGGSVAMATSFGTDLVIRFATERGDPADMLSEFSFKDMESYLLSGFERTPSNIEGLRVLDIKADFAQIRATPGQGLGVLGWLHASHLLAFSRTSKRDFEQALWPDE